MSHPEKIDDDMSMDEILASIRRIISEEAKIEENAHLNSFEQKKENKTLPFPKPQLAVSEPETTPEGESKNTEPSKPFLSGAKETLYGFPKNGMGDFSSAPPVFGNVNLAPPSPSVETENMAAHIASQTITPGKIEFPQSQNQTSIASPAVPSMPSLNIENQNSQLQSFIYDLIQPLLKDWVNAYLPNLIEKAVAQEVTKMFQKLREP